MSIGASSYNDWLCEILYAFRESKTNTLPLQLPTTTPLHQPNINPLRLQPNPPPHLNLAHLPPMQLAKAAHDSQGRRLKDIHLRVLALDHCCDEEDETESE